MTQIVEHFFTVLKECLEGKKPEITPEDMYIARVHQLDMLFIGCENIDNTYLMNKYAHQAYKSHKIFEMVKLLEENGVSCCVLKGLSLARFYPDYCMRYCTDTDILVNETDLVKIRHILKREGFTIYKMRVNEHHQCVSHPNAGTVEFHYRLYDEIFDELWFNDIITVEENMVSFDIEGNGLKTLGTTDGFIFTSLHFVKHYLMGKVTFRWVLDILLYAKYNSENIDWDRVWKVFAQANYEKLIKSILGIGVFLLGFDEAGWGETEFDKDVTLDVLKDIMVVNDKEYQKSIQGFVHAINSEIYLGAKYSDYIKRYEKLSWLHNIFASRAVLQYKYEYLQKYPFLLPLAWVQRGAVAAVRILLKQRKVEDFSVDVALKKKSSAIEDRLTLMRKLDIIK